jgi:hypothetical protein
LASAIDATKFIHYNKGVYNAKGSKPNFGVVVVGVSEKYWKVKTSLGSRWGEEGYARLAPGNSNGICDNAYEINL